MLYVLEKIFFYLDYESFKSCLEVSKAWHELLTSELSIKKGKDVYHDAILEDHKKL